MEYLSSTYRRSCTILFVILGFSSNMISIQSLTTSKGYAGAIEYCQFDNFDVTCGPSEVILIESARYGRMHLGRCIQQKFGFMGCVADVHAELDRRCSGRRKCHFPVHTLREFYQPCPADLTAYVESSHSCVEVVNLVNASCIPWSPLPINLTKGFISSIPMSSNGHGSPSCPLKLQGQVGQNINFTLYSLDPLNPSNHPNDMKCPFHAKIQDGDVKNITVPLCAKDKKRKENVYISSSSNVTFYMERNGLHDGSAYILLEYEVVGCPDPISPSNALMTRNGDRAVIKCNHTAETWYLTCRGRSWVGSVSNCTKISPWSSDRMVTGNDSFPLGLLIAVAIGVIVGIIMGIVMLVFVFYARRKTRREKIRSAKTLLEDDTCHDNEENYARRLMQTGVDSTPGKHGIPVTSGCHGDYTQMWELRRPIHPVTLSGEAVLESTYATRPARPGLSTLPKPCCGENSSLITFKPQEPIYDHNRYRVNTLLQNNVNNGAAVPLYYEMADDQRCPVVDCSEERPDLLASEDGQPSTGGTKGEVPPSGKATSGIIGGADHSHNARDACEYCAIQNSLENNCSSNAV